MAEACKWPDNAQTGQLLVQLLALRVESHHYHRGRGGWPGERGVGGGPIISPFPLSAQPPCSASSKGYLRAPPHSDDPPCQHREPEGGHSGWLTAHVADCLAGCARELQRQAAWGRWRGRPAPVHQKSCEAMPMMPRHEAPTISHASVNDTSPMPAVLAPAAADTQDVSRRATMRGAPWTWTARREAQGHTELALPSKHHHWVAMQCLHSSCAVLSTSEGVGVREESVRLQ